MKKIILLAATMLLLVALLSTPAMAHSGPKAVHSVPNKIHCSNWYVDYDWFPRGHVWGHYYQYCHYHSKHGIYGNFTHWGGWFKVK